MTISESLQSMVEPKLASTRTCLVLALVLPIFIIAPLFYPGYIQTHNGLVAVWNVADLRANLGNLNWLPHLAAQFDPLRGDGLLPYYLAAFLPFQPTVAVKVVLGLSLLLGSVGLFLWLKSWLGHYGALVSALVYTYLPYQIATLYVRGAWGEVLFWGILPWAILSATYLVTSPRLLILPVAAFFWTALGLSQLGLTIWAFIFVTLLLLVIHLRQSLLPILATLLGLGVTIIGYRFLTPFAVAPRIDFTDHFLYPAQLFSAYWGFGPSRPGWDDGLSLQLGLAALGLAVVSVTLWQRRPAPDSPINRTDRRLVFFLSATLILGLLQLGLASFVWKLPLWPGYVLANLLTYPWQLLGLTGLCLAILAGAALWLDWRLTHLPLFASIAIFIILSSYAYLSPQFMQIDPYVAGPQAELGDTQLALLDHNFSVVVSGNTAGLDRGEVAIPVAVYGRPRAQDVLQLNVVWQPLRAFDEDLKVFVHLVDPYDKVLAQYDGYPQSGDYPTSRWTPGELIEDVYPLLLPADAPPGPYRVFLGLYDEATLTRLPVPTNVEGRVILNVE